MNPSATRQAFAEWSLDPWPVVRKWFGGSVLAALLLLLATLAVAEIVPEHRSIDLGLPPVTAAGSSYVLTILGHNLLVLALHSMACLAGYIAGASVPSQTAHRHGLDREIHEHGAKLAIGFVIGATIFSLCNQVWTLGTAASAVARELHTSPPLLLLALTPHALTELTGMFLPLSAWVLASRRDRWDQLGAAALVTTALALPILVVAATWETFGAAHLVALVAGH